MLVVELVTFLAKAPLFITKSYSEKRLSSNSLSMSSNNSFCCGGRLESTLVFML